jgi:hypothetical protein
MPIEFDDTGNEMAPGLVEPHVEKECWKCEESTEVGSPAEQMTEGLTAPAKGREWDPTKHREWMRSALAIGLVINLPLLLTVCAAMLWSQRASIDEMSTFLGLVYTPIITLLGAAVGFYFGQRAGVC